MLCPKCGREYEGSECPYCSGPKILVNDSDYQKRRMAYEKKQAGERSASSDNQENTGDFDPSELVNSIKEGSKKGIDFLSEKTAQIHKNVRKKVAKNNKAEDSANSKKPLYTTRKADGNMPYSGPGGLLKLIRQHTRTCIISVVILLGVILSVLGIYRLATRKNYVLYMSSKGKIYNVAGLESKFVADTTDAIFEVSGNKFYTPDYPDEIDRSLVVETMASDSGKYFACETYDTNSLNFTLYLWNDNNCYKVLENEQEKSIKYITDKGVVVFTDSFVMTNDNNMTDTDEVNHEGAVTRVDYYVYDHNNSKNNQSKDNNKSSNGTLIKLDQNLKSVNLYSDKEMMICLNASNELYLYNYKDQTKKTVDINVKNLYCMSSDLNDVYSSQIDFVNTKKNVDDFFYSSDGGSYFYDISNEKTMKIGKETSTDTQFVNMNNAIYILQMGKISYTSVSNGKVAELKNVDTLGSSFSFITIPESGSVLYINADGNLMYANKGATKQIADAVTDGSLTKVGNETESFTYWKNGMQVYQKSISGKPIEMTGVAEQIKTDGMDDTSVAKNLGQVIYYKNKLYFYDSNGRLHSCTTKGSDNNLIGDVEQFWLGTELK